MVRVTNLEFDRIADRALARIAPRFRNRLGNVLIVVESEPPQPGLLGLYHGRPLTERSVFEAGGRMPDQITIYQGPHMRMARNLADLEQIVADTMWHEIAHYFGMNERQVLRAEKRRSNAAAILKKRQQSRRRGDPS